MRLAAIDIGSNSIHLVVVEARPGGRFDIIATEKVMVRLAAGALMSHHLNAGRVEMALQVISRFVKFARARGAEQILATATSAVRESTNQDAFISRVKALTGIDVEILSGLEEARLIALAVTEAIHLDNKRALIIDIGGGSTEFIITEGREPLLLRSMRLGAVRLAESAELSDPVKKKELLRLRQNLRADLVRTAQEVRDIGFDLVIGTSGTILNLVGMASQLRETENFVLSGDFTPFSQSCRFEDLAQINEWLAQMTEKSRARMPGLDPSRADIIVAGGQLLEAILREVGAKEIITCDWALREGVLLDYIAKHAELPHADLGVVGLDESALDARDRTILSIARRYEYQPVHSHQVARLAGQLFDDLRELHKLADSDRILLQYAALLHDIGYHISHLNHHRHAYYLIQNAEMPGFSAGEAAIIAGIVRFHRGSRPKRQRHPEYAMLNKQDRTRVRRMSALLRIADGLDRSHNAIVERVSAHRRGKGWEIELFSHQNVELELWYSQHTAAYFTEIFDTRLNIKAHQLDNPTPQPINDQQLATIN